MRRLLVSLAVVGILFSLLGAGSVSAAPEQWEPRIYFPQALTPVTLSDSGWSEEGIGTWDAATKTATLSVDLDRPAGLADPPAQIGRVVQDQAADVVLRRRGYARRRGYRWCRRHAWCRSH